MVRGSRFRAAIADRSLAGQQGLQELAYPVNDVAGNRTRFLLLQNGEVRCEGDIASLAFSLHQKTHIHQAHALKDAIQSGSC